MKRRHAQPILAQQWRPLAVAAVLLVLAVVLGPGAGTTVLAVVVASFALGAVHGAQGTWQGWLF